MNNQRIYKRIFTPFSIKLLAVLVIMFSLVVNLHAQEGEEVPLPKSLQKSKPFKPERKVKFTVGGGLGAQFGSGYGGFSIYPVVGVYPIDWLLVGLGCSYSYSYYTPYKESYHDFGAEAFVRGFFWKKRIIAHVGYQYYNFQGFTPSPAQKNRYDAHGIYIGPGYRQSMGEKVNLFIILMINIANWSTSSDFDSRYVFSPIYPNIGITVDL